jgi:hypothetical protein
MSSKNNHSASPGKSGCPPGTQASGSTSSVDQHGTVTPHNPAEGAPQPDPSQSIKKTPIISFRARSAIPPTYRTTASGKTSNYPSTKKPPDSHPPSSMPPPMYQTLTPNLAKMTQLKRDGTSIQLPQGQQLTLLSRDDALKQQSRSSGQSIRQPTFAPAGTKSILLTPRDTEMAARQTCIETLGPKLRAEQEKWAQMLIQRSKACPEGYVWNRMPGGYQCQGGGHGVTDELLAEGRGGIWALSSKDWEVKDGPYYPRDGAWFKAAQESSGETQN